MKVKGRWQNYTPESPEGRNLSHQIAISTAYALCGILNANEVGMSWHAADGTKHHNYI